MRELRDGESHQLCAPHTCLIPIFRPKNHLQEEAHHRAFFSLHDPGNVARRVRKALKTRLDDVFDRDYYDVVQQYAEVEMQEYQPEARDAKVYQELFSVEGREEEDVVTVDVE